MYLFIASNENSSTESLSILILPKITRTCIKKHHRELRLEKYETCPTVEQLMLPKNKIILKHAKWYVKHIVPNLFWLVACFIRNQSESIAAMLTLSQTLTLLIGCEHDIEMLLFNLKLHLLSFSTHLFNFIVVLHSNVLGIHKVLDQEATLPHA